MVEHEEHEVRVEKLAQSFLSTSRKSLDVEAWGTLMALAFSGRGMQ